MSAPNPLIPHGTFQAQAAKGASNVRLAVATIVAIHVVFFGGLLLQGCKRDGKVETAASDTNSTSLTNLSLAPIDSSSLYYPTGGVPSDASGPGHGNSQFAGTAESSAVRSLNATNPESMWQSTNLSGSAVTAAPGESGATKEYTVARGDSFGKIAKVNHTTVSALRKANPQVDPTKIRPGQKINVPMASPEPANATLNNTPAHGDTTAAAAAGNASGNTYSVKPGDTLTKIARREGVTVSQLRAANNLKTSRVDVGQKLKIPAKAATNTPATGSAPANQSAGQVF
jgi:LysM repeat protein